MGSYSGSVTADLEYALAFIESMIPILEAKPGRSRFRFINLSGKFVRQNQDEKLWVNDKPRKIKVSLIHLRAFRSNVCLRVCLRLELLHLQRAMPTSGRLSSSNQEVLCLGEYCLVVCWV